MNTQKNLTIVEEKKTWAKIRTFFKDNPQIFYKGIPMGVLAYVAFPYAILFWRWLPWLWAGYEVYHKMPPGSSTILWGAIQLYLLKR